MPFGREIRLRRVKCAAARRGFISFHFVPSTKFHNAQALFHILSSDKIFHHTKTHQGAVKKVPQRGSQCRMALATKKYKERLHPVEVAAVL